MYNVYQPGTADLSTRTFPATAPCFSPPGPLFLASSQRASASIQLFQVLGSPAAP